MCHVSQNLRNIKTTNLGLEPRNLQLIRKVTTTPETGALTITPVRLQNPLTFVKHIIKNHALQNRPSQMESNKMPEEYEDSVYQAALSTQKLYSMSFCFFIFILVLPVFGFESTLDLFCNRSEDTFTLRTVFFDGSSRV